MHLSYCQDVVVSSGVFDADFTYASLSKFLTYIPEKSNVTSEQQARIL
jgi:hypothetical protein